MKTGDVILFSDMKLGEGTIKFERQQLEIYTSLAKEHPENDYYKKTQLELARSLLHFESLII